MIIAQHMIAYMFKVIMAKFGGHSWGGINSGVSLSNNAIVARARWAFQVSQGSVEALFRWGGKRLHYVAANLFRKLSAKFHHNCPSFVGDITENILVSFFSGHGVYIFLWQFSVSTQCVLPLICSQFPSPHCIYHSGHTVLYLPILRPWQWSTRAEE